jgi:hypothetical protein
VFSFRQSFLTLERSMRRATFDVLGELSEGESGEAHASMSATVAPPRLHRANIAEGRVGTSRHGAGEAVIR